MPLHFIKPNWIGAPSNICAFSSTRIGGVSIAPYDDGSGNGGLNLGMHVGDRVVDVACNRDLITALLPQAPAWLNQVHGTRVLHAEQAWDNPDADASITTQGGAVCVVQTADCLPVLFCDIDGRVVGAAHAGWRGLLAGVLENTVQAMRGAGAGEILAWLGPAIGPNCFEVGAEVKQAFVAQKTANEDAFKPIIGAPEKFLANLPLLARKTLQSIDVHRVYGCDHCTMTDAQHFYSYRRDGVTGRMASMIWIDR